ncbi:hypothetical protein [Sphingobacterium sp. SYP-B4668]|uniref:hypothetical protein n=1 Tax=Sphingobacterium sp. SYP-B4668 TaxID=2996035 RepID=UPI0022DDB285|nr:hypothetical protein [Sphingobacterium sp. SYP-B4668]
MISRPPHKISTRFSQNLFVLVSILCLILSSCLIKSSIKSVFGSQPIEQTTHQSTKVNKLFTSTNSCLANYKEDTLLSNPKQASISNHLFFILVTGFLSFLGLNGYAEKKNSLLSVYRKAYGIQIPIFLKFRKLVI